MHWPEPLKDETLYSWLARLARINAVTSGLSLCNRMADSCATSIMDTRFNLASLCEKSGGCLGKPDRALRLMTPFHVAAHLGEVKAVSITDIESGIQTFDLTATEFGGFCRWRICPDCMTEDITEAGVAWWHRSHQLPTSLVCAIHGSLLQRFDVKRHRLHERFLLPIDLGSACLEEAAPMDIAQQRFWHELAQMGAAALQDISESPPLDTIRDALIAGLHQQGLVTRGGNLRRDDYLKTFGSRIGSISAPGLFKRCGAILEPMALVHGLWPGQRTQEPLIRLFLVHWLYGSWHRFRERCAWETVLGTKELAAERNEARRSSEISSNVRDAHRATCLAFLENEGDPSRGDFWRANPLCMRWLKRYDEAWLDVLFPLVKGKSGQKVLF